MNLDASDRLAKGAPMSTPNRPTCSSSIRASEWRGIYGSASAQQARARTISVAPSWVRRKSHVMAEIRFQIDGRIMAWTRPGQGRRRYDPPEQVAYKSLVAMLCKSAMRKTGQRLITGPVSFGVEVFYPQTKDTKSTTTRHWKTSVPDLDNIIKNIKDALKGIAWRDDAQVCHYKPSGKRYLPLGSPLSEHAVVKISDADGAPLAEGGLKKQQTAEHIATHAAEIVASDRQDATR